MNLPASQYHVVASSTGLANAEYSEVPLTAGQELSAGLSGARHFGVTFANILLYTILSPAQLTRIQGRN